MNYEQVKVQLGILASGAAHIRADKHLSDIGKERALKGLAAEREAFRAHAHVALAQEWRYLKARYKELAQEKKAAELLEAERWNYARLAHERLAMESRLKRVRNSIELTQIFEEISESGVPERQRALYELMPAYAEAHGSGSLAKLAEQALQELTTTPEMRKLSESGSSIVKRAQELQEVTLQAARFYGNESVWSTGNEFSSLLAGVEFSTRAHPETAGAFMETSLEIKEASGEAVGEAA